MYFPSLVSVLNMHVPPTLNENLHKTPQRRILKIAIEEGGTGANLQT